MLTIYLLFYLLSSPFYLYIFRLSDKKSVLCWNIFPYVKDNEDILSAIYLFNQYVTRALEWFIGNEFK